MNGLEKFVFLWYLSFLLFFPIDIKLWGEHGITVRMGYGCHEDSV